MSESQKLRALNETSEQRAKRGGATRGKKIDPLILAKIAETRKRNNLKRKNESI
jgi:hypothetical protein